MKIKLQIQTANKEVFITDEHAASSYGIPVITVEGDAYGKKDILPIWPEDELSWLSETAEATVAAAKIRMNEEGTLTQEESDFISLFLN